MFQLKAHLAKTHNIPTVTPMPSYTSYDLDGNNADNDEVLINNMGDIMEDGVNDKPHSGPWPS